MRGQKLSAKLLFLLALFFLLTIFFLVEENNGMNNAAQEREQSAQAPLPERPRMEPAARPAPQTPVALLPKPDLDVDALTLLAVFHARSLLASAVIDTEGHGAHRYHVGMELPAGGVLAEIRSTEVVIENGNQRVTLRMPLMGGDGRAQTAGADDEEPALNVYGPKMPRRVVNMLNKLDLSPVSERAPNGYKVGEDFPESGTEELGVKPGDTIVAINGYPVGEYHSDYLAWLSFRDSHRASVLVRTVEGKEFSFHYPDDVKGVGPPGPDG